MKTLNWSGYSTAPRRAAPHEPGWLERLVNLLLRGETPVDGHEDPARERHPEKNPEPVRWGNFR